MSYLLDTNICIHLFKGAGSVEARINQAGIGTCFLSEITIAELMFGVENSAPDRRLANQANLKWLYRAFTGRVLSIRDGLPVYAQQKARLRRAGRPVGEFDLLIGATAIAHNLTPVTRNTRDFVNLESIRLENWIDAQGAFTLLSVSNCLPDDSIKNGPQYQPRPTTKNCIL